MLLALALVVVLVMPLAASAHAPANEYFERTWARTDQLVLAGEITRTWIWGPHAFTQDCYEPYLESPDAERETQYFDKSRMEINDPLADSSATWFVTQGLLAKELITGEMQVGDDAFIDWGPADVHIAGDPDEDAPTYADFAALQAMAPVPEGQTIIQTFDGGEDPSLAQYGVTAAEYVAATNHRVASVFWEFMTSHGSVLENGALVTGPIFENPFYAVGFPLTEAYWVRVKVGGVERDVLVQAFERRVLTYTPSNDEEWRVEAGNVGQHYYIWRYGAMPEDTGDGCPDTMKVTFHVYEPRGEGQWEQIAITTTTEVWHPGGIATGIWRAYTGDQIDEAMLDSTGTLRADHRYSYVFGGRFLVALEAEIREIIGPTGGTAWISAGSFSPGGDPRIPGSTFTGSGSLTYETPTESGTVNFDVAGTQAGDYHVLLEGPAPPIFFPAE
jgi:hypothetical protein